MLDGYDHITRGLKSGAPTEFPPTDDLRDTPHYNVKIEECNFVQAAETISCRRD